MSTYGQIRLRLSKVAPGIDLELLDGWIQDRYTQMLDDLPWKRQETEAILQSPPSYAVGTVAAATGSTSITGTGTTWTSAMSGLMIRINNGTEYYTFTYVSATSGTLDRNFEQPTGAITAATVYASGSGFAVGDIFSVTGAGNGLATGQVSAVTNTGAVKSFTIQNGGSGYSVATGIGCTDSGAGTGLALSITTVSPSSLFSYRIDQNVFTLASAARIVRQVRPLHDKRAPLEMISPEELNRIDPFRNVYGTPRYVAATWDSNTSPPCLQVEFYPVPSSPDTYGSTLSYAVDYVYDQAAIVPSSTSTSLLPWTRPACIIAGVEADIAAHRGDAAKVQIKEARFAMLLQQMKQINALQRGPQPLRVAPELRRQSPSQYRGRRWVSALGGFYSDGSNG